MAVIAKTRYTVPSSGEIVIGGPKRLRVVLAPSPEVPSQEKDAERSAPAPLVQRSGDNATYVVLPPPGTRLSFDITLASQ
jgi:hypothetical protein